MKTWVDFRIIFMSQMSAHPPCDPSKVHHPWALFRETTVCEAKNDLSVNPKAASIQPVMTKEEVQHILIFAQNR